MTSSTDKIVIEQMEIHGWHRCNLACESCSHFSPHMKTAGPSADDCIAWMELWRDKILPRKFKIVGGEPLLNRDINLVIRAAGQIWPQSQIVLSSNGLVLKRAPEAFQALAEVGGKLFLSLHHDAPDYRTRFDQSVAMAEQVRTDIGLEIDILDSFSNWTRRYDETGGAIGLYRSDPARAWSACRARFIQLFDGKLWKCPSVAYLPLIPPEHMRDIEAQALFKTYRPLEADADHREIQDFLGRREEHVCSCCPEMIETFQPGSPMPPSRDGRNYDDDDRV